MKRYFFYILLISWGLPGCKKYLDAKPDKKLELPASIADIQALLDNQGIMNLNNPGTGEVSADNYYLTGGAWAAVPGLSERNMYIWESDITVNDFPNHWSRLYDIVTISNVALESISKITPAENEQSDWNNVRGSALLYRAKSFLTVAGFWAKAYDETTAGTDLGIPLRLSSDYHEPTIRSSVQATYAQVVNDCKEAATLLPPRPRHVMRPSAGAAFALLARTYLMMGLFDSAGIYAGKCLEISGALMDYNTLDTGAAFPVTQYNTEVIMNSIIPVPQILYGPSVRIDTTLYRSYDDNDLRKAIFFTSNGDGSYSFKGSYDQSIALFNGLATDEMYLVKAECLARTGNIDKAMATLNTLLVNRWKTGTFIPFAASDMLSALQIILPERRKELVFRDLRWTDLKRLNKEVAFQQTIRRELNGQEYKLVPGDNRYALPIPQSVISISGIQQNPR